MALRTLGTTTTSILKALQWNGPGSLAQADVAALAALMLYDSGPQLGQQVPGIFENSGKLVIPNTRRNYSPLILQSGDVVAVDPATGWPILVSAAAIVSGSTDWVLV